MKKLLIFILLLGFSCQSDDPQPVKEPVKKSTEQTPPSGSGGGSGSGSGSGGGGCVGCGSGGGGGGGN